MDYEGEGRAECYRIFFYVRVVLRVGDSFSYLEEIGYVV